MSRLKSFCCAIFLTAAKMGHANDNAAGQFDYYVLSLSWSPNWCVLEGDRRKSEQCDPSRKHGFVLHGLWPQYETGWPSNCRSSFRDPSRADTRAMSDIMGSSGSAWHQWKKHGRCSGLSSSDYFATARRAFGQVQRPEILRRINKTLNIAPKVVEAAWLEENEDLWDDAVTITCKSNMIQEVRICLSKELEPRTCGRDVIRDCSAKSATLHPIR